MEPARPTSAGFPAPSGQGTRGSRPHARRRRKSRVAEETEETELELEGRRLVPPRGVCRGEDVRGGARENKGPKPNRATPRDARRARARAIRASFSTSDTYAPRYILSDITYPRLKEEGIYHSCSSYTTERVFRAASMSSVKRSRSVCAWSICAWTAFASVNRSACASPRGPCEARASARPGTARRGTA